MKHIRILLAASALLAAVPASAQDLVKMTIGQRGNWDTAVPHLGEKVSKSGARTDVTHGIVDGCGRYYLPAENGLTYREMDGFRVVPEKEGDDLSGFGDSGAVWYSSADRQGVGLHVGGQTAADPRGEHSIACYLPRVLDRLGVDPLKEAPRPFVDAVLRDSAPSFRELAEAVARLADAVERLLHARG